jgi:hypothetical protein
MQQFVVSFAVINGQDRGNHDHLHLDLGLKSVLGFARRE